MRGFHPGACPDAVAIDASETKKIKIGLADIVENFIGWKWLWRRSAQAHAIPDFRFVIPNRRAGALPYSRTAILSRIISYQLVTRFTPENHPGHVLRDLWSGYLLDHGATTCQDPGTVK